ncbi:VWA domain-containing protein [Candidatus Laterigemmans baculatus]|uniref:VWA domain-containing protein n=1 Tax=Candidatus Laterigemmans baculatus TaxID=2770505 RepID=UPI0013DA43DF|nr:VWA domain-containing protein [Candidatus Laterigemmans baculatus]
MFGSEFSLELWRPGWLVGLLLLGVLWWFYRYSLSDFSCGQRRLSLAVRSAVVVLLVLAAAGLTARTVTRQRMTVVAVDHSLSVDESAAEKVQELAEQLRRAAASNQRLAFLRFAAAPEPVDDSEDAVDRWAEQPLSDEQRSGTDLAAAIRVAAAAIEPEYVPDVVILSDGNPTSGDAVAAAAAAGVPVHTISLPVRDEPEIQLSEVLLPAQVREGEPFHVEIVVRSNVAGPATLDLYRDDIRVQDGEAGQSVTLKEGENRFRIRQTIEDARQTEYTARVESSRDTLLDNNAASGLVFAAGRPSVLVCDSSGDATDAFRWALEEQDIRVEVRDPEGLPRDLAELQKFDCLVLSNVPATAMSVRQMELIRSYVQDLGGGLVMTGGDQAFGLGGYYKTTLEEILPVRSNFEKEREKPSLAMVLVIDKSGSMGGQKIELAKDAAKAAVELLGPRDAVGVIAFDGSSNWVSPLQNGSSQGAILDRISSIQASGGTSIYPALADAHDALLAASAKLKHVILLTDGHSSPGDFEGLATDMSAARMTISTVAVGQEADDQLLEQLAEIGRGRYYHCDDPASVPQVFAKETVEASKSAINELPFLPQLVRPTAVLGGLELEAAPLLLGYVVTRPKPTSEFILASEAGDPLLVWWRYGLGMTVAFTSDIGPRWSAEWLSWPEFGTFWAQTIRHAMRKSDAAGAFVEVVREEDQARIVLDSVDPVDNFVNDAPTTLTLIRPGQVAERMEMQPTAPGRYEAKFPADARGAYLMEISQDRGGEMMRQNRGLVVGYPTELRLQSVDRDLLRQIAEISGGRLEPTPAELTAADGRSARRRVALWPWLLIVALLLFVLDVALRRIDFARLPRVRTEKSSPVVPDPVPSG